MFSRKNRACYAPTLTNSPLPTEDTHPPPGSTNPNTTSTILPNGRNRDAKRSRRIVRTRFLQSRLVPSR